MTQVAALLYALVVAGAILFQFCLVAAALADVGRLCGFGRAGVKHAFELDHPIPSRETPVGPGNHRDAGVGGVRSIWKATDIGGCK